MKKTFFISAKFFFAVFFLLSSVSLAQDKPKQVQSHEYESNLIQLEVGFGVANSRFSIPFSIGFRQRISGNLYFEQTLNVGMVFNSQSERDEYVERSSANSEYRWDSSVERCRAANGQFTESSNCNNEPPLNISVYGNSEVQYSIYTGSGRNGDWFFTFGTGLAYGKVFGEIFETGIFGSSFTLRMDQFSNASNSYGFDTGFFIRSIIPYGQDGFQSFSAGSSFLF